MEKVKHLEIIQAVINRMNNNSFLLKGWCVTLVSALIALGAKDSDKLFILVGYYPILMFWILDAYYLWQERLFRKLYDKIREEADDTADFSMSTELVKKETPSWLQTAFSVTLFVFYGTMAGAIWVAILIVTR